jgi:hypothetical protein
MSRILIETAARVEYLNQRSFTSSESFTVLCIPYSSNTCHNNSFISLLFMFLLINPSHSGIFILKITLPTVVSIASQL